MKKINAFKVLAVSSSLMLSAAAHASFSEHESIGQQIVHHMSSNGVDQICVIPEHFTGAAYSSDDMKVEQQLCGMERGVNVAMCAKIDSTNPGINVHSIPAGMTAAQVEAGECNAKGAKKVAKYKLSTSCSYTPSIVGYYHVSRMLGGIADVSQAVIHTMDKEEHIVMARDGLARTKPTDIIHQTWQTLFEILTGAPQISPLKRAAVMTVEGDQSYGGFIVNDKDQVDYPELYNGQHAPLLRTQAFMAKNPSYIGLKHAGPISDIVGADYNAANLQSLVRMRDVADMIVIDTIMSQQDRFGNINGRIDYAVKDSSGIHIVKKNAAPSDAIPVKVMLLRDNDCGVNKTNIALQAHMLEGIRHINPETYSHVMEMARASQLSSTEQFFKTELVFTTADYATYKKNLAHVAGVLSAACRAGTLHQDLDLNAQFMGSPVPTSCN